MIDTVYIETEIWDHPRTKEILSRFPAAKKIPCERYGEIFNVKAQNFRLQKKKPALILAKKFKHYVLEIPKHCADSMGQQNGYYFSHMLNCPYDCRYCFLQGMYESAHYVVFVNFEDFEAAIEEKIKEAPNQEMYFFSGYDCDSLAFESVTGFAQYFIPVFRRHPNATLELRTKSTQIQCLLKQQPVPNCIVAFSLNPEEVVQTLEHQTPSLEKRLDAMKQLALKGWKLGLRFDPLIDYEGCLEHYRELFERVFAELPQDSIHSVSLGLFRVPREMFERMYRLYPDEKLFSRALEIKSGMVSLKDADALRLKLNAQLPLGVNHIPIDQTKSMARSFMQSLRGMRRIHQIL